MHYNYTFVWKLVWRQISIQCKMSRDRLLASAFFWITNSQAEQISVAVVDFTHFKRKRSLKIDRATFCTEWKSAFSWQTSMKFFREVRDILLLAHSGNLISDEDLVLLLDLNIFNNIDRFTKSLFDLNTLSDGECTSELRFLNNYITIWQKIENSKPNRVLQRIRDWWDSIFVYFP